MTFMNSSRSNATWYKAGKIKYTKVGRNIVFDPDELKAFKRDKINGLVKSRRWCHCERSEAISLDVTA